MLQNLMPKIMGFIVIIITLALVPLSIPQIPQSSPGLHQPAVGTSPSSWE